MPTAKYGPQQFELVVTDSYASNNRSNSNRTIDVKLAVQVTLHWNFGRTELDPKKDVQFSNPRWLGVGKGPHPVFKDQIGPGRDRIGSISWDVSTEVLRIIETNTAGKKYRNVITPSVRLIRTYVPSDGGSPQVNETIPRLQTVRGNWVAIP